MCLCVSPPILTANICIYFSEGFPSKPLAANQPCVQPTLVVLGHQYQGIVLSQ